MLCPFVSCGHYIVCPTSIYGFWLHLWSLLVIILSVLPPFTASDYTFGLCWSLYCLLPRFTASDYTFGLCWSLYCLSFLHLRLLITSLVSIGHYIVCPASIYGFWLHLWSLLVIILSVLPRFTASDYTFGIFKLAWDKFNNVKFC